MHCVRKVKDDLLWIGGNDRRIARFENIFPLPRGVAYNSYLLTDEKTVLFDASDNAIREQFAENLQYGLNGRPLDYIVVHHVEPDHSALLKDVLTLHPQATIVCSMQAKNMIGRFFTHVDDSSFQVVKEGDMLQTGRHTLQFFAAPMVHWPEVMVSYDSMDKVLFSADAYGTFGALNGTIFADEFTFDSAWMDDARRYYANIVGKYGAQVQTLLKKAEGLAVDTICPLHGPIWRNGALGPLPQKYDLWSRYEPEERTVMIAYASMYGHTEQAADALAAMLAERGVRDIRVFDVSKTDVSELISEVFRCSHLVLAAPTYNGGLHPKMDAFLADMKALSVQNRTVALLDNGTWAPAAARLMRGILESMKNMTVLDTTLSVQSALHEGDEAALAAIADALKASL